MKNPNYYFLAITVFSIFLFSSFKKSYPHVSEIAQAETKKKAKKLTRKQKKEIEIKKVIQRVSEETGTPPELIEAICKVESNLDVHAFKRNDGGRKNHAFGACQVLRKTGEALLGKRDKGCDRDFRTTPKSHRTGKECFLFDPYQNIKAAALYIQGHIKRYDNLEDVIAGYNAGSAKRKKKSGKLINEKYVGKVYNKLGIEKLAIAKTEVTAQNG